jgi:hypothetical protein
MGPNDSELLKQTFNMVLGMHQEWPRVTSALVKLETRVTALETRPRSEPPSRSHREVESFRTDTGTYRIPPEVMHEIQQAMQLQENAQSWAAFKELAKRIAGPVLAGVILTAVGWTLHWIVTLKH